jgi:hypothetical protein
MGGFVGGFVVLGGVVVEVPEFVLGLFTGLVEVGCCVPLQSPPIPVADDDVWPALLVVVVPETLEGDVEPVVPAVAEVEPLGAVVLLEVEVLLPVAEPFTSQLLVPTVAGLLVGVVAVVVSGVVPVAPGVPWVAEGIVEGVLCGAPVVVPVVVVPVCAAPVVVIPVCAPPVVVVGAGAVLVCAASAALARTNESRHVFLMNISP